MTKLERILKLIEEFVGSQNLLTRAYGALADVNIYRNPKSRELKTALDASKRIGSIRFCVDFERKEVFAWQGDVLHDDVYNEFMPKVDKSKFFKGSADYKTGRMEIDIEDNNVAYHKKVKASDFAYIKSQLEKNQKWLLKYFTNVKEIITEPEKLPMGKWVIG